MTADGLVSVIIPTYYRNDRLPEAIESALAQTYDPVEVIVVDDSGEANAEPVAKEYDVTYVAHEENQGGNPARNTGFERSEGNFIQLLDDDDVIDEKKIEKQVDLMESSHGVGVVYCGLEYENGEQVHPAPDCRGEVLQQALAFSMHPCQTGSMLIDAEVFDTIYPLVSRDAADDIGMKIRLAKMTEFDYVEEVLFFKRESERHRSEKPAFADELERILHQFDSEYRNAPSLVSKEAKRTLHQSRGYLLMKRRFWSPRAIKSFALALIYTDRIDPVLVGALIASLFGSPGHVVASTVYSNVLD
jgi:glycosyltransferase involved in cell wall biosynthesis